MSEVQKETSGKKCYGCASYKCFYSKAFVRFEKERLGRCIKHARITQNQDICENWSNNKYIRSRRATLSVKALNETIAQLSDMIILISEDIENKHDDSKN